MTSLSIVITTFNRPYKCINCIKAILSQSSLKDFNYQLIIIDDKSSEKNFKLIKSYVFQKDILLIRHNTNRGLAAAQIFKLSILKKIKGYRSNVLSGVDHDIWISLAKKINPVVEVCWDLYPSVSNDLSSNRITTNEQKRLSEIKKSLLIWKSDIIKTFGNKFYRHFYNSYELYNQYSFLVRDLKLGNFKKALLRINNLNIIFLFLKRILRINNNRCNRFPRFSK